VSCADACDLALEARLKVAKGSDPATEKQAARQVLTFGQLATNYIDNYAKPNKKSWQEDQQQLCANLLPKWENRPAAEIISEHVLGILHVKVTAGSPVAANRLRSMISRIYTFGAEQQLFAASVNPVIASKGL
jgi:DNA-binding transcriptional regulator YbjK